VIGVDGECHGLRVTQVTALLVLAAAAFFDTMAALI
jgi:hypothetical protein